MGRNSICWICVARTGKLPYQIVVSNSINSELSMWFVSDSVCTGSIVQFIFTDGDRSVCVWVSKS